MEKSFPSSSYFRHFVILCTLCLGLFSCGKKDTTPPVVTLEGESNIHLILNTIYNDLGATATDAEDGVLSVSVDGEVNPDFEGTYTLTYSAYDDAGNRGSATRWVHVFNAASYLKGNFNTTYTSSSGNGSYVSTISTSTTQNQRIWIEGFGVLENALVFADLIGLQIQLPVQEAEIGGNLHYFSGSGQIDTTSMISINLTFSDSTQFEVITGTNSLTIGGKSFIHQ